MLGRIARSLKARGVLGTLKLSVLQPYLLWREREFNKIRLRAQAEFDRDHSVDTGGIVYLGDLVIPGENVAYGARYGPTLRTTFREIMGKLAIDHQRFTFIDIGSGKGAVLFYASDYAFDKIIGVEFAPDLHKCAAQNLVNYRSGSQKCFNLEAICADATQYSLPIVPLVLYFAAPFGLRVMTFVIDQIVQSFRRHPRDGYLIYNHVGHYPDVDALLIGAEGLQLLLDQQTYRIWGIRPEQC
jgi:hypothetical protein